MFPQLENGREFYLDMRSIELYDFLKLDFDEQHHMAVTEGRFLQFKVGKGKVHALYALGLFFVNLRYRQNTLEMITPFRDGNLLNLHTKVTLDF